MYIANQFASGTGVKHGETIAEALKSAAADFKTVVADLKTGVAVFEAGEKASGFIQN